jgi:hypothetical protein
MTANGCRKKMQLLKAVLELKSSQVPHHLSALLLSSSANTVLISETNKM